MRDLLIGSCAGIDRTPAGTLASCTNSRDIWDLCPEEGNPPACIQSVRELP